MVSAGKKMILLCSLLAELGLAAPQYDLVQLEKLAQESSRALQAARDRVDAARSAIDTAAAWPNPEVEYLTGMQRARAPGGLPGDVRSYALTQPVDLPWQRQPRIAAATAGLAASEAERSVFEADLLARLRLRYYELLRREADLMNAQEDAALMENVRAGIALRVDLGEAPRYELIKAEAEMLNAQKSAQVAGIRLEQARAHLRQVVGVALPKDFTVSGRLRDVPELLPREELRRQMVGNSPDLARLRAESQRAEELLRHERSLRLPRLAIRAAVDEDPDVRAAKFGVALTLPLWDWRRGPIGQAAAEFSRARNELAAQELSLAEQLEIACQQYEIARSQVTALESGIVRQAENALKVAEAAYRFGERGYLEVIDAQRVRRAARLELIAARFELAAAWVEIERLRALPAGSNE